ncbi:MAG: segregation/condensation protein A [Armatimonadota bacterium]|nr:segregation/condensation protein A [bacterium]MDW8320495.1 segregation/condensation protein A [Armatimonadota bacterium]
MDLLLHLVRENKVSVTDIPIAVITDQYLEYLRLMEELDLEIASEFLVMAATLLEIKSRMLLPKPPRTGDEEEEEDPRAELVARLVEYQKYKALVETLQTWEAERKQWFFRDPDAPVPDYELPIPVGELTPQHLLRALERLLAETVDSPPPAILIPRRKLSLRLKIVEVWRRIQSAVEGLRFEQLLDMPFTKWDVLLTFLAVLELIRQERVEVRQEALFGEITLWARQEGTDGHTAA